MVLILLRGPAAIHGQSDACSKACARRAKEQHGGGDFLDFAEAPDRMLGDHEIMACCIGAHRGIDISFNDRRAHRVDAHALRAELDCGRLGETDDGKLARVVDGRVWNDSQYRPV